MPDRKPLILLGAVVTALIIGGTGLLAYRSHLVSSANPLSDDASVEADVSRIAPSIPGRVKAIHVHDNGEVKAGDLLVELDETPYRLALEQARADLEIAMAARSDQARSIRAEQANLAIAEEQVVRATNNLELATQTLGRLLPMQERGFVSAQQVDDATTLQRDAEVSLNEARRQLEAAEALVGDEEGAQALIRAREAAVAIAEHELAGTKIEAPFDGRVTGMSVSVGDYVLPAQSLFSLIDTSRWIVSANYTETTLPGIEVGDCATVYVLADRTRPMQGRVEGIGWGVASRDVIQVPSALPIVPKSLDWVRVQQRFPVHIRIDDPLLDLMRVGASAVAVVHENEGC
ncbi:multidrug transporter subunit MdtN [Rhodovulum sp. 12E13]|uniref:multidrug transporter subunit MdtN n=1 Tax=Rhodovulum sp. 12E13 TaxID=2203891 RepID=UPI000E15BB39|nr:multidrug transporter subunit MdtN [Rhodovulum sp. 12E13]RDC69755.1 multidrug transporter subunit MdtN [Rhodovulum sp. 12E13]